MLLGVATSSLALGALSSASGPSPAGATTPAGPSWAAPSGPGYHQHDGANGETDVNSCSTAVAPDVARCLARVRTEQSARSAHPARPGSARPSTTLGNGGAYDPPYLQSAYQTPSASGGAGQTVAIVDAYDDPTAAADLSSYRSFFGLSACTTANSCFRKVNQSGGSTLPAANSNWAEEISLDLDMVSAICPNCHILLVEAGSASFANLGAAVDEAVALGANVVSNSYGGSEYGGEVQDNASYYNHPGVAIVASSGDNGYGTEFPAASPNVTAVGGTSLYQATNTGTRNATETAWSGAGSGCSAIEPKPAWQHDGGCPTGRTVADVSAVADPNTGVWVYDTYGLSGWAVFGGTSVASPIIGSIYALAGNPTGTSAQMASYPYNQPGALNDVTSGSNGSCGGSYLCTAVVGYDGPTGLGTPLGTAAFTACTSTTVPCAPALSASAANTSATLSWSAPASGPAPASYNVYRGTTPGGESLLASGVTATTYPDTGLTNGTTYYYKVYGVNGAGQGAASNEVSATPSTPATVPGAPTSLSASTASRRGVNLSWKAPSSNGGSSITGYKLYRSTSSGAEVFVTDVSCTTSTCSASDTGTSRNVTYFYKVAAVNAVGTGSQSNEASARAR